MTIPPASCSGRRISCLYCSDYSAALFLTELISMFNFDNFARDPDNVLILLHGFLGNSREWQSIREKLLSRVECRILIPDLPGHGKCRLNPDETFQLSDIITFPKNCREYIIWGYSMGGRIALMEANRYFKRLSKDESISSYANLPSLTNLPGLAGLIIESSNPGIADPKEREKRILLDEKWAEEFEKNPLTATLKKWYEQPVFSSLSEKQKELLIREKSEENPKLLAKALRCFSTGKQENLEGVLDLVPVLYFCGENDSKYAKIAEELHVRHKSISVCRIPGGDHNLHRFHSEEMLKQIFEWQ